MSYDTKHDGEAFLVFIIFCSCVLFMGGVFGWTAKIFIDGGKRDAIEQNCNSRG